MPPPIRSLADFVRFSGFRTSLRGALRYLFGKRGHRLVHGLRLMYRIRINIMLHSVEPVGKLTRGREVRLWIDGAESFRRLEQLIRRSRFSIVIQMFIWKDDETGRRMAHALVQAADRGVSVDITKEAVGDFFEFRGDFLSTRHSNEPVWQAFWGHANIHVTHNAQKDHGKVYIFDGQILLLSGMNIADEYRFVQHDYLVELRGEAYVEQYLLRRALSADHGSVQLIMNTDEQKEIRPALHRLLESAQESVVIEHCYFSDPDIARRVVELTKRRVRVTVIIPSVADWHHHANLATVGQLMGACNPYWLRVFIYPRIFHAKAILVDGKTAFIGSANLYRESIDEMGEVNVLIQGRYRAVWKLRESLRDGILKSRPLTSPPRLLWLSRWLSWLGM